MKSGFVSILGRPNAGKSTLLNAVLGQKLAIVTSKPQTTRTSIQGVVTTDDYQIVFVDTPGIHRSNTLLNKRMMDTVRASASADVVLFLIDVLEPFTEEDAQSVDLIKKLEAPAFAVLNKVDKLADKAKLLALIEHIQTLHQFAEFIPISAMKGTGVDTLIKEIVKRLPEGEAMFPEDHLTDQPSRFPGVRNFAGKDPASHAERSSTLGGRADRYVGGYAEGPENCSDDLCREAWPESDPDRRGGGEPEEDRHAGALRNGKDV